MTNLPENEEAASTEGSGRGRQRMALWLSVGFAIVATIALVTFWSVRSAGEPQPAPSPTLTASVPSTPTPTPSEESATTAEPAVPTSIALPTECSELYSHDLFESLLQQEHLSPLNDPMHTQPNFSNVDELEELLLSLDYLSCTWGGASDMGIVTAAARVTTEQGLQAVETMTANGFNCYSELEGTRCLMREDADDRGTPVAYGESHFVRDDVWLSTFWVNAPLKGYTEDMVATLWG